jgi:tight adherence protein C
MALVFSLLNRQNLRVTARVRQLAGPGASRGEGGGPARRGSADLIADLLARIPFCMAALRGGGEERLAHLRERFGRAGIYSQHAPTIFLAVRVFLASAGVPLALGVGLAHLLPPARVLPAGVVLAGFGLLAPSLWLDARIARWQAALRRGLPDTMDMLVLCLEGGSSFSASFQCVLGELLRAHPELGGELEIVRHETLLGKTPGEAMQKFGRRCGLEEVTTLAAVLLQNERYGVSVAKALSLHADTMRQQRQQRAEELAQKAAVKILFPTLLCIFPAIFIVVLGPAAFQISRMFAR